MESIPDQIRHSNAWDERYQLPLLPGFNNPWIYMAYLDLAARLAGGPPLSRLLIFSHFLACEVEGQPGLFWRWPDRSGGATSWDEIIGAAYFLPSIAERILGHLDRQDGDFNNTGEPDREPGQHNAYRLLFLRPYLLACSGDGYRVSLASQLIWSACTVLAAFLNTEPHDAGGRLRTWLQASKMRRYPLCLPAVWFWLWKMKRASHTLKGTLALEPGACPILAQLAPEAFSWPDESDGNTPRNNSPSRPAHL